MMDMMKLIGLLLLLTSAAAAQTIGAAIPGQSPPASTTVVWMARTIVQTVTCPAAFLEVGDSMTCTATLNQAAPADKTVTPTTSDATKITVSAPFVIPKNSTSGTFTITAI